MDKPTDVTYKLIDLNKEEVVQHRNNLLHYYPIEHALRELTQLYSFLLLYRTIVPQKQGKNRKFENKI